ncbi:DUF397 domain-containing protein [Nocardiopsis sediminis]|uniref:DUF397 domain-containing protein n=1 Tax=Nocardiopsis sediminis TaxID=1778267 RepID=A0ABV8FMC1_9ACTN
MTTQPTRLNWRKSSFSGANDCVEVAETARVGGVAVRDSQNPAGHLEFNHAEWRAFVEAVGAGEL